MSFITDYIQDTATNMLNTGIKAAGGLAGTAIGGAGTAIEIASRNMGDAVTGFIGKGGNYVNSFGDRLTSATASQNSALTRTVVKPSAGSTKKALPSSGKPKALPAPYESQYPRKSAAGTGRPKARKALPEPVKTAPAAQKTLPATQKSLQTKPTPSADGNGKAVGKENKALYAVSSGGKVRIAPESRPKSLNSAAAKGKSAPASAKTATPKIAPGAGTPKSAAGAGAGVTSQKNKAGNFMVSAASKPKLPVKN